MREKFNREEDLGSMDDGGCSRLCVRRLDVGGDVLEDSVSLPDFLSGELGAQIREVSDDGGRSILDEVRKTGKFSPSALFVFPGAAARWEAFLDQQQPDRMKLVANLHDVLQSPEFEEFMDASSSVQMMTLGIGAAAPSSTRAVLKRLAPLSPVDLHFVDANPDMLRFAIPVFSDAIGLDNLPRVTVNVFTFHQAPDYASRRPRDSSRLVQLLGLNTARSQVDLPNFRRLLRSPRDRLLVSFPMLNDDVLSTASFVRFVDDSFVLTALDRFCEVMRRAGIDVDSQVLIGNISSSLAADGDTPSFSVSVRLPDCLRDEADLPEHVVIFRLELFTTERIDEWLARYGLCVITHSDSPRSGASDLDYRVVLASPGSQ